MKQPNNTMIYNTALYLRLSRDDELQGESGSIQTQRMMLRQYAEEHGLTVVGEYIDDGWSGTNFDRPGFQRMIDDIEEGKINCVVTKDLSRLGRNYILTGQYTEIYFPSKGIRYIAVNDNVDTLNGEKLHLLFKEMRVGLVNGALLAVMALGFLGVYIHFFKAYAWGQAFLLSGCVGISLIVAMVISSLVGTVIPMLFHKIHIDPAVASGPLITTINDLVAVVVYYGLAMVVLIDLFHLG